jgi:WD40 repeat protein
VQSGVCEKTLEGHFGRVTSIAFSPNNICLASSSQDRIWLWDVQSGLCGQILENARDVTSVAFSLDSTYLASGSGDTTIRVWDIMSGAELASVASSSQVSSCSWHSRGTPYLASAHEDGSVRYWHVKFFYNLAGKTVSASLQLIWASKQNTLSATACDLSGARKLSTSNAALLAQRGAVGEPAPPSAAPKAAAQVVSRATPPGSGSPAGLLPAPRRATPSTSAAATAQNLSQSEIRSVEQIL